MFPTQTPPQWNVGRWLYGTGSGGCGQSPLPWFCCVPCLSLHGTPYHNAHSLPQSLERLHVIREYGLREEIINIGHPGLDSVPDRHRALLTLFGNQNNENENHETVRLQRMRIAQRLREETQTYSYTLSVDSYNALR